MSESSEKIINRIQGLYAKAASSDFGPEADAYLAKADEMMLKYNIEQAEIAMSNTGGKDNPHGFESRFIARDFMDGFGWFLVKLVESAAYFCDCKVADAHGSNEDGLRGCIIVGTKHDLDHMMVLYTNIMSHMANTISPRFSAHLTESENIYRMKMAGYRWKDIHEMMSPGVLWERKYGVRYTKLMKDHAEKNDLPRNMVGGSGGQENYRNQFANAYTSSLMERMRKAKGERPEEPSSALVLVNKDDALNEFLWTINPDLRPHPSDCDCDLCHNCQDPSCLRRSCVARRMPITRRMAKPKMVRRHLAAEAAGRSAANTADLGQTKVGGKRGTLS